MINLTTKLKAYPRIEPSILKNYYTKDETESLVQTELEGYVKEVENPSADTIYGRSLVDGSMKWVDIFGQNPYVLYSINNNAGGSGELDFPTSSDISGFQEAFKSENTYTISFAPITPGYLWICSNKEISKVEFITQGNILNTTESIVKVKDLQIPIMNDGEETDLIREVHCYRTNIKYAATGAIYNWEVTLA